jgi:hypothetical protein
MVHESCRDASTSERALSLAAGLYERMLLGSMPQYSLADAISKVLRTCLAPVVLMLNPSNLDDFTAVSQSPSFVSVHVAVGVAEIISGLSPLAHRGTTGRS